MAKKKAKKNVVKKCSCEGLDPVIVASKVKAYIKSKKMMTSSDALSALNCKVYCMLEDAIARTKANKRSTVKPQDL